MRSVLLYFQRTLVPWTRKCCVRLGSMVLYCARDSSFVVRKSSTNGIKYVRRKTGLPLASKIFHFTIEVGQRGVGHWES